MVIIRVITQVLTLVAILQCQSLLRLVAAHGLLLPGLPPQLPPRVLAGRTGQSLPCYSVCEAGAAGLLAPTSV